MKIVLEMYDVPEKIVYARCVPGATYRMTEEAGLCNICEYGCSLSFGCCVHTIIGKWMVYDEQGTGLSGLGAWLLGVEWSPEINEQDTVYSLDEEISIKYQDIEGNISDEDFDKWYNIKYGE